MRLLWIGGNHPRHLFFANAIEQTFGLCGAVIQRREHLVPDPPERIAAVDRDNFVRHFANRAKAEELYFGQPSEPDCPIYTVDCEAQLNTIAVADFVRTALPDLIFVFGTGLIRDPLFSSLPCPTVNLHLGLSPRYRGAATLFWPFYFLEPSYAGSTLHYIVGEPDAGDVIHQVVPRLEPTDGIHDVACKTLAESAAETVEVFALFKRRGSWKTQKQRGTGKNFLSSDFRPEHLRVIYNMFDDDIVRHFIERKLEPRVPKLVRQI